LIECIPTLVRDMARNTEDVLKIDYSENYIGDDPADCARYGLHHMMRRAVKPDQVKLEERVQESEVLSRRESEPGVADRRPRREEALCQTHKRASKSLS
jgi:hypothetical protein